MRVRLAEPPDVLERGGAEGGVEVGVGQSEEAPADSMQVIARRR
jgi:hypothetical protein